MPTTRSIKPLLRAVFLLVPLTLLVCFVVLEIGLRLQGHLPSNTTDGIFEAHGSAYRLKPNQAKLTRTPSFTCTICTNALGLRDRVPGPRALAHPYVAWAGDSATFANGVEYEQSFVGLFGAAAERYGLEAVNLAVGGHHIAEQEDAIKDFLAEAPRKPDALVVVFTPQFMAFFERRYEDVVVRNGYIFQKGHWFWPYLLVMLNNASSAYDFLRDGVRDLQTRWFHSAPGAAAEVLEIYARSYPAASPEATRRFEERIAALDERIRAAGVAPIHAYLPTTVDMRARELLALTGRSADAYDFDHYRDAIRRESEQVRVPLVDLTETLDAEHAKHPMLGFSRDMHYNAVAHVAIARALADAILARDGDTDAGAGLAEGEAVRQTTAHARRE